MIYPIDRLNHIDPLYAARAWAESATAVNKVRYRIEQKCPYCHGRKFLPLGPERCPHCDEKGQVIAPVWWLDDPHGGWDCCPICFEGQNPTNEPCDICRWWINELGVNLPAPPEKILKPVIKACIEIESPDPNKHWLDLDLLYTLAYEGVFQLEVARDRTLSMMDPIEDLEPGEPGPQYEPNPALDQLVEDIKKGHALLDYLHPPRPDQYIPF